MICNFSGIFSPTLVSSAGKSVSSLVESNKTKVEKDIEKFMESISGYEE